VIHDRPFRVARNVIATVLILLIIAMTAFACFANQAVDDGGNVGGGGAELLLLVLGLPWSFFLLLAQQDSASDWYSMGLGLLAMLNVVIYWWMAAVRARRVTGQ